MVADGSVLREELVAGVIHCGSGRLRTRLGLVVVMQTVGELFPGDALAAAVADDHRAIGFVSPPSHARIMARIGNRNKITRVMRGGNGEAKARKWTGWKTERRIRARVAFESPARGVR